MMNTGWVGWEHSGKRQLAAFHASSIGTHNEQLRSYNTCCIVLAQLYVVVIIKYTVA